MGSHERKKSGKWEKGKGHLESPIEVVEGEGGSRHKHVGLGRNFHNPQIPAASQNSTQG